MKIIHLITAFGIGGAERLLLNVVNKQVEKNIVHIVYFKNKDDLINDLDSRVIVRRIPFTLNVASKVKEYFKTIHPDIIHTHLGHADFIGLWAARNCKAKVFCTMHNIYFKKAIIDQLYFKIYTFLFLKVVSNSKIISISKSVEEHVVKKIKLPAERSLLLENAIPLKEIIKVEKSKEIINLLFVGRLEKQKSLDTLLKAIQILSKQKIDNSFHLNLVGEGTLRKKLEFLSKELEIDKLVTFHGVQKKVDYFYGFSDIFILPSIWEGFGIVILEAFSYKVPVIASNIEGPAELIKDNYNGFLFTPLDYKELANKILELILNAPKRKMLGQNGYQTFTDKYHINSYVEKLNNFYKNA